jgi:membrane protein required for colicin V production
MINNFFEEIFSYMNIFDLIFFIILIYFTIQCFFKGFTLSLISFTKWIISTIITIILVPKFQPTVSDYIESEFINNVGLGMTIFAMILFFTILIGKSLGKAVTWTGVGSVDKSFGLIFGVLKGYIVAVCIFSILNWFYPYKNWGISAEKAFTFDLVNNGSKILVEEFPSSEDFIDTKEKIEKI